MDAAQPLDTQTAPLWSALSDATRRRILDLLRQRPRTTGDIAGHFAISRIAVMRHLDVLADAGLVASRKRGRERWHYVNLVPLIRLYRRWSTPIGEGWAHRLVHLSDHVESHAAMNAEQPRVDIAFDVSIGAPAAVVFAALTQQPGAWWGHPFLRSQAGGLRLEARLGGLLVEEWPDGGAVVASVTALAEGRFLQLTGPFHLGCALGVAEFAIAEVGNSANVAFSFKAVGAIDEELAQQFAGGWRELIAVRLKEFVEHGGPV